MADKKTVSELKKAKKKWIEIVAPKEFNGAVIGETLCSELNSVIGKRLSVNLMQLTGDIKKQSINIKFRIDKVSGNQALTEIVGYELSSFYLKRLTRRTKGKLEDSFLAESKDKVKFRIKPLMFAKNETKKSIMAHLRKEIRNFLIENSAKLDFSQVIYSVISNQFQKELKQSLKKIYPLAISEIRVLEKERV